MCLKWHVFGASGAEHIFAAVLLLRRILRDLICRDLILSTQRKALNTSVLCRALLHETGVSWKSHWVEVKALIAEDPRYAAMPRTERDTYFRKYRAELEVCAPQVCRLLGRRRVLRAELWECHAAVMKEAVSGWGRRL